MNQFENFSEPARIVVDMTGRLPGYLYPRLDRKGLRGVRFVETGQDIEIVAQQRDITRQQLIDVVVNAGYIVKEERQ